MQELSPAYVLKRDFLIPNNWSVTDLAEILMMPTLEIRALLENKLPVTYMRACHLAAGLGSSVDYWLKLEQIKLRQR